MTPAKNPFRVLVIPADLDVPARVETVRRRESLRRMQGFVGGLIEGVNVSRVLTDEGMQDVSCTVYVNEEGRLRRMTINLRATDFLAATLGGQFTGYGVIRGDVVVVGPPNDEGEELSVPDDVVQIVEELGWMETTR